MEPLGLYSLTHLLVECPKRPALRTTSRAGIALVFAELDAYGGHPVCGGDCHNEVRALAGVNALGGKVTEPQVLVKELPFPCLLTVMCRHSACSHMTFPSRSIHTLVQVCRPLPSHSAIGYCRKLGGK